MALFKSAFIVSFFIAISRILGFIRDVLIAKFMGVSLLSDVFFAAFRLPNFFRRIFAEGAFNSAFVPIFIKKSETNSQKSAIIFAKNIFSFLLYILIILIILMEIFMPFFIKILFPGFNDGSEKFLLLVDLSRITIIYLLFISLVSLFSGILNSVGKFAAGAAVPIILNLTLIASLYLLADYSQNLAYALSFGLFIAGILQFCWMMFFLIKKKIFIYPTMPKINQDTKKFFRKLIPGIVGANVMQINLLIDTVIASLMAGAISYLYYADRVNQLPLAMIGIAISIALLPALSNKIKNKKYDEAIKLQNIALQIALMLIIPAMLALNCLSFEIISTLFQRGQFDEKSSQMVAQALAIYALGLPAYVLVKIFEPSFFARGNTKTPMKIAIICLFSNLILNLILFLPFGYLGIVISSVLSSYLNLSLLIFKLIKNKHFIFEKNSLRNLINILIPAIIMLIFLVISKNYLTLNGKIIELLTLILIGLFSYIAPSYLMGNIKFIRDNFRL